MQSGNSTFPRVQRAVGRLLVMLLAEFVLGVLLTTVISFDPTKHGVVQTVVLTAHILLGIGLLVGSFAHILTSRRSRLLGANPTLGFLLILGAFASGSVATNNGNNVAVLFMALCFGAAITVYGLSYITVKLANTMRWAGGAGHTSPQ
jgi:hypothetical protein